MILTIMIYVDEFACSLLCFSYLFLFDVSATEIYSMSATDPFCALANSEQSGVSVIGLEII